MTEPAENQVVVEMSVCNTCRRGCVRITTPHGVYVVCGAKRLSRKKDNTPCCEGDQ